MVGRVGQDEDEEGGRREQGDDGGRGLGAIETSFGQREEGKRGKKGAMGNGR